MADDEPDRLSQLPDDLLHHILQLAPCREAESTAVLSRRWRGLWPPPTSAVEFRIPATDSDGFDHRPPMSAVKLRTPSIDNDRFHRRRRDALLRGAKEALVATKGHVKRLSIHVDEGCEFVDNVVSDVLSYWAARGVQDVRIAGDDSIPKASDNDDSSLSWLPNDEVGVFEFSFGSMASAALRLRVLHITNCSDLTPPPRASTFPCLEVLRLRKCNVDLQSLQDMVVASPQLAALQLEYVFLRSAVDTDLNTENEWQGQYIYNEWQGYYNYSDDYSKRRWYSAQSFCCPGITTLVLLNCEGEWGNNIAVELDVPRVQHFRYRGRINQFTLRSPLPDVRRVYLHFLENECERYAQCDMFWNIVKNFGNTKVMKLKLESRINYVAVPEKKRFMALLGETLFNVEDLDIDAWHESTSDEDTAVAIGNLLHCCPFILDVRLKLNSTDQLRTTRNSRINFLKNKSQSLEFHKSVDHFRHRRDRPMIPFPGDDDKVEVVSDIPSLSDRWFDLSCLQFHLRRLSLQFQMDKPDCVGVHLAKLFVERGLALEEMYIDDGDMRPWEHMICRISGYEAGPQPSSEHHVLARMSPALSMNQFSSSKINVWFHHLGLEVTRTQSTHASSAVSRSFTILPVADA